MALSYIAKKGCFDNINHTKLIKQLWHMGIHDRRILMILKKMLKAGVMNELAFTEIGTPQGGIISPLLANVYLHKLDKWIVREWEEKPTKFNYKNSVNKTEALRKRSNLKPAYLVRYADDWVLITSTKSNAEKWKKRIEKFLDTKLILKLEPRKNTHHKCQGKRNPLPWFQLQTSTLRKRKKWIYITN